MSPEDYEVSAHEVDWASVALLLHAGKITVDDFVNLAVRTVA